MLWSCPAGLRMVREYTRVPATPEVLLEGTHWGSFSTYNNWTFAIPPKLLVRRYGIAPCFIMYLYYYNWPSIAWYIMSPLHLEIHTEKSYSRRSLISDFSHIESFRRWRKHSIRMSIVSIMFLFSLHLRIVLILNLEIVSILNSSMPNYKCGLRRTCSEILAQF